MKKFDIIVAGAGIWGCAVARRLAEAGKKVLVLEKRPVVGGNVRCEIDPETGIEVHTYGSHIFHTHIPEVWAFVNRFVKFNGYQHKVLAKTKKIGTVGKCLNVGMDKCLNGDDYHLYHLPLGLTLINKFFGVELKPSEVQSFLDGTYTPPTFNLPPSTSDRRSAIFDAFFRGYTSKQWGKAPEEIDPSIIKRVPVRSNYDTNYFNDYWQGIPSEGYNKLFERLLEHPNITVKISSSLKLKNGGSEFVLVDERTKEETPLCNNSAPRQLYYSGPIDALFDYKFGPLPWRTLRFETERVPVADYQGTAVVNYTDADVPYTRIHEFKHYHPEKVEVKVEGGQRKMISRWGFDAPKTIIMREYSAQWKPGDEPYYPVNTPESAALLARYQSEVERFNSRSQESKSKSGIDDAHSSTSTSNFNLVLGGRLGQYKYFDMDKSIEAALKVEI